MKVVVRQKAAHQVGFIYEYVAERNPRAARDIVDRIYASVERVASPEFAHLGRPGKRRGTRELVERPYVIVYRVDEAREEIVFLSVVHGARRR